MWAFLKFIVYMFSYFDLWSPYFIPVCPNLNTLKSVMEKYRYKLNIIKREIPVRYYKCYAPKPLCIDLLYCNFPVHVNTAASGDRLDCCKENRGEENCEIPILLHPYDPFYSEFGRSCLNFVRSEGSPNLKCNYGKYISIHFFLLLAT